MCKMILNVFFLLCQCNQPGEQDYRINADLLLLDIYTWKEITQRLNLTVSVYCNFFNTFHQETLQFAFTFSASLQLTLPSAKASILVNRLFSSVSSKLKGLCIPNQDKSFVGFCLSRSIRLLESFTSSSLVHSRKLMKSLAAWCSLAHWCMVLIQVTKIN